MPPGYLVKDVIAEECCSGSGREVRPMAQLLAEGLAIGERYCADLRSVLPEIVEVRGSWMCCRV